MDHPSQSEYERSKLEAVYDFARGITVYGTPILLAIIGGYLVLQAFGQGFAIGFRSLASVLFPLVIASFFYVFNRDLLRRLGEVSTILGFLIGFAMGIILMLVFQLTPRSNNIPLGELVLSGCFSVLVFASISSPGDKIFTYYYGTLSGLLLYVIVRGFPLAG